MDLNHSHFGFRTDRVLNQRNQFVKMFVKTLTIVALLAVASAAPANWNTTGSEGRVVNGVIAVRGDIPWHAHIDIQQSNGNIIFCGGALISREWVVTVAECVNQAAAGRVLLGSLRFGVGFESGISDVVVHPRYSENRANNVALLRLARPINFSFDVQGALLPPSRFQSFHFENHFGRFSGFGSRGKSIHRCGPRQPTNVPSFPCAGVNPNLDLEWTYLRVTSTNDCFRRFPHVSQAVLCAAPFNAWRGTPGFGDGGSPLVWRFQNRDFLIGLFAYGQPEEIFRGQPAGFVRIPVFTPWISSVTGIRVA